MAKTAKAVETKPKWQKIIDLHEKGLIDLNKLNAMRGYGKTIEDNYRATYQTECAYQDYVKAAKEAGITLTPKRRSNISSISKKPVTLSLAEMMRKVKEVQDKFDAFKEGKHTGLDVVASKIVDIKNVMSEIGVNNLDELNEYVTSLGGKTEVE